MLKRDVNFDENSIWESVLGRRDIFEVNEFIQKYPSSALINKANLLFQELKKEELTLMPINHSSRCLALIRLNIFSIDELIETGALTEQSYEKILDIDRFLFDNRLKFPDDYYNITSYNGDVMFTDVFLFGVESYNMRMSILQGILASALFRVDIKGTFEERLQSYSKKGVLFPYTRPSWFTPIISGTIRNHCRINFIDPSFDCIINDRLNDKDAIETKILRNNHRKIFFFLIDPTTTGGIRFSREIKDGYDEKTGVPLTHLMNYVVDQRTLIERMVNFFDKPSNSDIMKKVDAMHFVICNAEKISELGVDKIKEEYSFLIDTLHCICRHYNINKQNNYMPNIYPFSLGSYFTSDAYEYDSDDSDKILEIIYKHCTEKKRKGINNVFRKIIDFLSSGK